MATNYIVGIDEVGRGPIAGPVSIGIVIIPESFDISYDFREVGKVTDSKQMTAKARERVRACADELRAQGDIQFGVYSVDAGIIDEWGIEYAIQSAIKTGLATLAPHPTHSKLFLDGRLKAPTEYNQETIIGGDALVPAISLASIVAKIERDEYMVSHVHTAYPEYRFDSHKGYGTKLHYQMITVYGLSPYHRRSYL